MTISSRIDNYVFQRVKRSGFVNLPGRHWIFCQQQGSKNLFSNTCQGGSKRKVLVAKEAVKLKFQSPNWQIQRNALLALPVWCTCVFEVVIVWLIGPSKPYIRRSKLSSCKCRTLYWLLKSLWNFPPLCCWCLLSVLLWTFFFEFFFFFFFFFRTLAANARLCRCTGALSSLKPELSENSESCGWLKRVIFLRPTKLRWSRKEKLREGT